MVAALSPDTDRRPVARHLTIVGPLRQEALDDRAARGAVPSAVFGERAARGAVPSAVFDERVARGAVPSAVFDERVARGAGPSAVPETAPRQGPAGACWSPATHRRGPAGARRSPAARRRGPAGARRSPAAAGRRRHAPEVYRRRRIVALGLLAFTILGLWVAVHGLLGGSSDSLGATRPISSRQVVVRPGDTLWSIALASGVHGDIRPLVDQLSAEVHGRPLQVGQLISIP
jgi:hypothetical protein